MAFATKMVKLAFAGKNLDKGLILALHYVLAHLVELSPALQSAAKKYHMEIKSKMFLAGCVLFYFLNTIPITHSLYLYIY